MMDDPDPWANAWGDSLHSTNIPTVSSSWTGLQTHVVEDQQEADIGMPSWSTAVRWNEPSGVEGSLWSQPTAPAELWEPSPYESIPIAKSIVLEPPPPSPKAEYTEEPSLPVPPAPSTPPQDVPCQPTPPPVNVTFDSPSSPPLTPQSPSVPAPTSPDVFGTFETASAEVPWVKATSNLPISPTLEANNEWGSAWGQPIAEVQKTDEPADEWEMARRQKEEQDRHVPPELMASILQKFHELADDLWPEPEISPDQRATEEQYWRDCLRNGFKGVEGLEAIAATVIPQDLTLPHPIPFNKTATAKNMTDALRTTRHVPFVRSSPFAHFMASKGSTAWEAAVKARSDGVQDDSPPGWRIVEKKVEAAPVVGSGKGKKTGGLLSFLGRKAASSPVENASPERSSSPAATLVVSASKNVSTDTSRPNLENTKPPTANLPGKNASSVASSSSAHLPALPAQIPTAVAITPSETIPDPTPPSVVSRFFDRLSRTRGPSGGPNAIALSSDDLEFLSDIVPSASDDVSGITAGDPPLLALSGVVESSLTQAKLPLPMAPSSKVVQISKSNGPLDSIKPFDGNLNRPLTFSAPPTRSQTTGPTSFSGNRFPEAMMTTSFSTSSSTPPSSIKLPPPPSSRSRTPISQTIPMLSKPAPPSPAPPSQQTAHKPVTTTSDLLGDVDFSEFHFSPPLVASHSSESFDLSFSSSTSSRKGLVSGPANTSTKPDVSFDSDDFDDFVSSPIRTPSPPRPPLKSPKPRPALSPLKSMIPAQPPGRRLSQAADHSRTLALLENAASRVGRWPASPSPVPEALPPPGGASSDADLLGGGPTMQRQQISAMKTSVSSPIIGGRSDLASFNGLSHPPPLPPPHGNALKDPSFPSLVRPPSRPLVPTNVISSSKSVSSTGGLSAQDLSFFEGL